MPQVLWMRRVSDIDDRGSVRLRLPRHRIDGRRHVIGAAVMADIGDPAIALVMDGRLIGATRLEIVAADQLHVGSLRRRADRLLLRVGGGAASEKDEAGSKWDATEHKF